MLYDRVHRLLVFGALVALILLTPAVGAPSATSAASPISFTKSTLAGAGFAVTNPTSLTFGPDGRLYVAQQEGRIQALTIGASPDQVTAVEEVTSDADLQEVFGIAFDPTDASSPPPVYASNTVSGFGGGGPAADGSFPGKITKIDGAGYTNITDIITGLSVSNVAHQANGIAFAADGTLYIAHGSSTNAGIPSFLFLREEVPLSGAMLVADISAPGFDGAITYDPPNTYSSTVDQVSGDVSVFASGLRNPYDLEIHSNGRIYATDNGPNAGVGAASTGCATQQPSSTESDELNLIEAGEYYGHPNRNRGRFDARQCVYHSGAEGDGADWTGPIELLPTSSNGLVEYTASTFDGKLLGNLFYVSFVAQTMGRIVLSPDGTSVVSHTDIESGFDEPLDITMGPDGSLYIAEHGGDDVIVLAPPIVEPTPTEQPPPVGGVAFLPDQDELPLAAPTSSGGRLPLWIAIAAFGVFATMGVGARVWRRR